MPGFVEPVTDVGSTGASEAVSAMPVPRSTSCWKRIAPVAATGLMRALSASVETCANCQMAPGTNRLRLVTNQIRTAGPSGSASPHHRRLRDQVRTSRSQVSTVSSEAATRGTGLRRIGTAASSAR
jgi:hypothetical protein